MHEYFLTVILVSFCLRITRWYNSYNVKLICYSNNIQQENTLVEFMEHSLVKNIYAVDQHKMYMHIEYKEWHKHLYKIWIYPVMITWNNRSPSYHLRILIWNWSTRKIIIITRNVDIFMLHIFYILNVITTDVKLAIYLALVVLWISINK